MSTASATNPDSVRDALNRTNTVVSGEKLDLDGTLNYFETDEPMGTTPTLSMAGTTSTGRPVRKFLLEEVTYYMNPTNAVTYQLHLLEDSSADDVQQYTDQLFFSPAAQADSVIYSYRTSGYQATVSTAEVIQYKLPRIVELATPGVLYYMLDWSGAPGDTFGFIKIKGRLLK